MAQANTTLTRSAPKAGETTWLWLYKQITGPLILILILIHFVVNHAISDLGLLTHSEVVAYYQNWIIPVMEAVFLILVVSHSLLGLRSIALDLRPSRAALRVLDAVFWVVGIVSVVYGIWLIRAIMAFSG